MYCSRWRHIHVCFLCIIVIFLGCNRPPDSTKIIPPDGTNQELVQRPEPVAEKPPKEGPSDPPTTEPKGQDADRDQHSFTLNPTNTGAVYGNVHLYHINHLSHPAAWDDEPFFVVWTDARGYSNAAGINVSQGGPDKKATDPAEHSFQVNLTLLYGGKDNEYDRETKCSFHIKDLDQKGHVEEGQKGQLEIDGQTYDVAKGTLVLVAGKDDDVRVKLLSRSKLPRDLKEVIAFGNADADISAFFPDLKTLPFFSETAKSK